MRVEGAFFVRNAFQDESDHWTVEGILEELGVPRVPHKVRGLLFFAKVSLTPDEVNDHPPTYALGWLSPSGKGPHRTAQSTLKSIKVKQNGSGTSAIREVLELQVREEGPHRLVIFVNGEPKHALTLDVFERD